MSSNFMKASMQVFPTTNDNLCSEVEAIKQRFSMKEKELSLAVKKVEELLQELSDRRSNNSRQLKGKMSVNNSLPDRDQRVLESFPCLIELSSAQDSSKVVKEAFSSSSISAASNEPRRFDSKFSWFNKASLESPFLNPNDSSQEVVRYAKHLDIVDKYTTRFPNQMIDRQKRSVTDFLSGQLVRLNVHRALSQDQNESKTANNSLLENIELVDKLSKRIVTTPRAVHRKHLFNEHNLIEPITNSQSFGEDEEMSPSPSPSSKLSTSTNVRLQGPTCSWKSCLRKGYLTLPDRSKGRQVSFDPLAVLLDAALEGELDLVQEYITKMSNVSIANNEGITALHNAICAGHTDIALLLLNAGADVNAADADGWTPLHCAASCNNLLLAQLLVEHGASLFARTFSDMELPLDKCKDEEETCCADYLYAAQEKLGIWNEGVVYGLYNYSAQNRDELSFKINDNILIVRKNDSVENEWYWSDTVNGKRQCGGFVPRNFIGLCPRILPLR